MSKIFRRILNLERIKSVWITKRNFANNPGPLNVYVKWFCGVTIAGASLAVFYNINQMKKQLEPKTSPKILEINKQENIADLNLRDKFNFINKVVEKCAPAVVYVEIKDPRRLERGSESALVVSNGSGFVVREDGWILTNAHVVISRPNAVIEVKMNDGTKYQATVEDADMNIDLALIKINPTTKLPALNLAKSGDVHVGEWVVALGSPLSLSHSATAGVVSSVNREAGELGLKNYQMRYIQTDAPITFGNSGGPLVNLDGDVIGINNLRITAGISFAIPIDYVAKFLDKIKNNSIELLNKKLIYNNIGVTAITITPNIKQEASHFQNEEDLSHGVLIWKIVSNGLGAKSGLKQGDIITHVDGLEVASAREVYSKLSKKNKMHQVDLVRKGQKMKLLVINE